MAAIEKDYEKVTGEYWDKLLTGARPDVDSTVRRAMRAVPRDASLALIRESFAFDPVPALKKYTGPVMAIITDFNNTPTELHALVPSLRHETIPGTSHWPQMDKPDEFNRMVDGFLARIGER